MVEIEIFADEIIQPYDYNRDRVRILGIGCLFIPLDQKEKLIRDLLNFRCIKNSKWHIHRKDCNQPNGCKKEYHNFNDTEIHHVELREGHASFAKKKISKKWLQYIKSRYSNSPIKFNILFIDLDKLHISDFGEKAVYLNMYNKFFRTVIKYGVKTFFKNQKVSIKKVFHDDGSMKSHPHFPLNNLSRLNGELEFGNKIKDTEIKFLNSDHKYYLTENVEDVKNSNLIQLIDLILGVVSQNIFYLSNDFLKKENAMILRRYINSIIFENSDRNKPHYGHQNIAFFPDRRSNKQIFDNLDGNTISVGRFGRFHYNVIMKMPDINQESLAKWQ